MKRKKIMTASLIILFVTALLAAPLEQVKSPLLKSWPRYLEMKKTSEFRMDWISIGPVFNSARVESVQGDPERPGTMYAAFGSGNLWKTTDGGLSWRPLFENQSALGIGDIALAPSNPEIIWLGSGESLKKARNFTMPGTGVFRSDDGGETWRNCGLHDSYHIGEIAVHPQDPETAIVAVQGHFWSTNENRGLYRTTDGGKTWRHVLYVDQRVGANDVVISPSNPDIVYASMWENNPGVSGPRSGVYKSTDGGATWLRLLGGLPDGPRTGRIGLAVSWTDPDKAYALVDNLNKDRRLSAEVYKTLDGGGTWERTHEQDLLIFPGIGWYFADCYVNPKNDDEVFALGVRLARSSDGGATFQPVEGTVRHLVPNPTEVLHLDHCEMWINPDNPDHLVLGNDGGLYTSYNKGGSWLHLNNIPAGEFYDVSAGGGDPYLVYGGVQDDSSVYGPALEWDPRFDDGWKYVWVDAWAGGDGCYTMADPEDPGTVYFSSQNGAARRKDMNKGRSVSIRPRLPRGHEGRMRYNFITPYIISPHNRLTLYHAGNFVFKSLDRGDSWRLISPDLSLSSIENKASTAVGAIAESILKPGLLYAGTDRGAFWVTDNDGYSWEERSLGLPDAYIRSICSSRYKEGRVYLTLTGINTDDLQCHIFVSENNGRTWTSIQADLPDEPAYCILEDPVRENIIYAGLYRGAYISTDRGLSWSLLGPGLPASAVSKLVIQEETMDLLAGTHGRGIYKMNVRPIQEASSGPERNRLFETPPARRPWINDSHRDPSLKTVERVPITFYLSSEAEVSLRVLDGKKRELWSYTLKAKKGFNQYRWDLVVQKVNSTEPYFIHYRRFLPAGDYILQVTGPQIALEGTLKVVERTRSQNE
jgi:photosystem II stability/assembly factor-like uncharacterized protein